MLRPHFRAIAAQIIILVAILPVAGDAGEYSKWEWANPVPQGNRLFGVVHGNSQWVMVGMVGTVLTSPDGTSPVHRYTGFTGGLGDVVWTGSQYIAAGGSIATSPDGVTWTEQDTGQVVGDIAWNGSIAVAVGGFGTILTSPDGQTWTPRTSGTTRNLNAVTWGGGQFVAVGHVSTILTSPDGINWTSQGGGGTNNNDVTWSGSRYVIVGQDAGIYSSPDGIAWTQESTTATGSLLGVTWTGSQFVAVGTYYIITSPDGMVWTNREFLSGLGFNAVDSSPAGDLVAVGDAGRVYTSPDGITWTDQVFDVTWRTHDDIGFNGSDFVAAGGFILHSVDGVTWTNPDTAPTYMREVAWGAGRWAMVGGSGTILSSPDGLSWTTETSGTSDTLEGITFGNGQFIAVGANGTILTSPDGMSWTGQVSGVTTTLEAVTWGGAQYVVVGRGSTILTSPDGVNWSDHTQTGSQTLEDACWTGSRFVVVGTGGTVFTSNDGVVWEGHAFPGSAWAVAWNGLEVTVVTASGQVWTSPEGINWTEQVSPTINQLKGMTAVGTDLWVVGDQSLILHRFEEIDFGDAPDPTYPTLLASDGVRHLLGGPLFLGSLVDAEPDGQPTAGADGDDLDGNDDEDGVVFISSIGAGLVASLEVTASGSGMLNAWVDFNADGDWDDAGEQIFTDEVLAAGVNPLSFAVPAGATLGTTYARFRLDTNGGLAPSGYATDGEVEDYQLEIVQGPDLQIEMAASAPYVPSGHPLSYTVTVTNNGPLTATSVNVTDTLPGELIFVSSTPGAPDCTHAAGTLTCDLGTMAPTETAQITIETVLDHPVWGTVNNTSSVAANETDPITANNTDTVETNIALFVDGFESGDLTAWD